MENILASLDFKKLSEVPKPPMRHPFNPVGRPIRLATYIHPKTPYKLKVYFSDDIVIGVWNDGGKKQLTAWRPVTFQNIKYEFGI
jgi:hypothetical protein